MAKGQEIIDVLMMLAAAYPHFNLNEYTISVYRSMLRDLEIEHLKAAAMECASSSKFFPSVHELREAAVKLQIRSNRVPTTSEAWAEMINAPAHGVHHRVTNEQDTEGRWIVEQWDHRFSHPLVGKVARDMGWPDRFWTDSLMSDRSRFMNAYDAELEKATGEARSLPEVREYVEKKSLSGGQPIGELLESFRREAYD